MARRIRGVKSMQSTALAKRLWVEDIMVQTGSGAVVANSCFQKFMLKVLKIKEADMVRPTNQQQPLFPEKVGEDNRLCTVLEKGQHR